MIQNKNRLIEFSNNSDVFEIERKKKTKIIILMFLFS